MVSTGGRSAIPILWLFGIGLVTRGAKRGRRERRFEAVEVNPDRRLAVGQRLGVGLADTGARQRLPGGAGAGVEAGAEAVDHCDRHRGGDAAPALPFVEA